MKLNSISIKKYCILQKLGGIRKFTEKLYISLVTRVFTHRGASECVGWLYELYIFINLVAGFGS